MVRFEKNIVGFNWPLLNLENELILNHPNCEMHNWYQFHFHNLYFCIFTIFIFTKSVCNKKIARIVWDIDFVHVNNLTDNSLLRSLTEVTISFDLFTRKLKRFKCSTKSPQKKLRYSSMTNVEVEGKTGNEWMTLLSLFASLSSDMKV